jgi:hypothetical protein
MLLATIMQFGGESHETSMLEYPNGNGPAITHAWCALKDLTQMSSPLQNYKITVTMSSPSKVIINLEHEKSDWLRLKVKPSWSCHTHVYLPVHRKQRGP